MTARRSDLVPAMSENEQRRAARKRLQAQYRALYDEVVDILFEADPIGVHAHHNVEKFVPEAISILARLRDARFAQDVEQIVPARAATLVRLSTLGTPGSRAARSSDNRDLLSMESLSRRIRSLNHGRDPGFRAHPSRACVCL
jgi:hypothetical protein